MKLIVAMLDAGYMYSDMQFMHVDLQASTLEVASH